MAIIKKTLSSKNLANYSVLVNDTDTNSRYFKITELPDTFTGGKNAFLVAGGPELVPDTKIQIELKDSNGDVIYHEPGEGLISSSINGESFVTEYYEGVSKVVSVYIYPDTAFGECTLTILGELNQYTDTNGIVVPVPLDWENKYNVKWQKSINVNPSLANTTKIRFYQRPTASISEILSPIYKIENDLKVASAVTQSFANIKLSNLETFAGDVKRVKVFRTSEGDISDYDLIQDILIESKELLTSYGLSGSVVGQTGLLTSETLKNYWNTGSLNAYLTSSRVESGVRLTGSGNFTYTSSLDIKSTNAYELNLDAFYSSSTSSNLGIYLSWVSQSTTFSSSIATLTGTTPTKNLLDTVIPFKITKDYPSASLYFSQSRGEWHLGNISLKLSQDTAFSPDEISFVTTMPSLIENQTYNFKFEFYDVNNNYVPVAVTQSALFTGGNVGDTAKLLTFTTDRSAFRFSTGSFANPVNQTVKLSVQKTNLTASVTYASSAFDVGGNYITPASYAGTYPGALTAANNNGALLTIANFSGSVASVLVGSIVYTASCEGFTEFETIYRFEDGDNAPGVFATANTNQFIYKATDLSLNPTGQIITIEAKRKNLASAVTPLTINSGSGKPALTFVSTNTTTGVDTYTLAGSSYPYSTNETIYFISGSDQFSNQFSDSIKISPVKILDGFSVAVSNENTSFPALSIGTVVGGFAASSGSITVKVGNETINYSSTFITNSFSASISAFSNLTPNTFNGTNYSINALSADSGSLTLLVKYKDGGGTIISSSKEITYSKAKIGTPNIVVAVSPAAQSVTANSLGNNASTPTSLVVTALEGGTNRLTGNVGAVGTGVTIGTISGGTIPLSAVTTDNASVAITVNYTDSEGTTGTKTLTATISKAKAAAPTTLALLSSETQTILSSSAGFAAPATFTTTVNEGSSGYTYDASLASNSTYYVSSITGGTNSSGTITPTTPTTITGTTVSLTISYKNSEGTTGTITKSHKVAVSLEGVKGNNGNVGADGKRTAANMVHYQSSIASPGPSAPTATSYTFATNAFTRLTAGWGLGAPTYASGNSNKYWYSTYTVVETTAGGGTGTPTFGSPIQAIGFSGLVSFTAPNNVGDGANTLSFGVAGATLINGSNISTGIIKSTNFDFGGADTDASGSFMEEGTIFNLDNGSLRSKNFYINQTGDAFFKGTLSAAGGTFSGNISAATGTFTGGVSGTGYTLNNSGLSLTNTASSISLGNGVTLSSSGLVGTGFTLNSSGLNLTNTASSISVGNGVTLNSSGLSGTGFSLVTAGLTATAGTIAGWTIDGATGFQKVSGNYILKLNANAQKITITKTNPVDSLDVVVLDSSETIPQIVASDTATINYSNNNQVVTQSVFPDNSAYFNTGYELGSGGSYQTSTGEFGIIGLVYANEEIGIEASTFPSIVNVIQDNSYDGNSYSDYMCILRVRQFPTETDAVNQTNANAAFGDQEVIVAEASKGAQSGVEYEDVRNVYGATIQVTGGGGINTVGLGTWYRVEIYQRWSASNDAPNAFGSITCRRPAGNIVVRYGRVSNGYSVLSPGGLQIYQGFRNYMNVSSPSGSTGVASNFCLIKGKTEVVGSLNVTSGFSAANKQFKIKHPVNENKWLYHTSIEAPRADLIYRGKIELINGRGSSSIDMDARMTNGTFEALTKNRQLFLQNELGFDRVIGSIESGSISIISENVNSNDTINWLIIGERKDEDILNSPLYNSNGDYKPERFTTEYAKIFKKELLEKIQSGSI